MHTVTYYVYDKAGNVGTSSYSIVYDSIRPVINLIEDEETIKINMDDANKLNEDTTVMYYMSIYSNDFDSFHGSEVKLGESISKLAGNIGYYIYVDVANLIDKAGNVVDFAESNACDKIVNSNYVRLLARKDAAETDEDIYKVTGNINAPDPIAELTEKTMMFISDVPTSETKNVYQIQGLDYIMITINAGFETSVGDLISRFDLELVSADYEIVTARHRAYVGAIVKTIGGNKYKALTIVVIYNAPVVSENTATSITINQGDVLENVGVTFVKENDERIEIDTLITLNGAKVKELDTNIPGVYSIKQIAKDSKGRTTTIVREVIVNTKEEQLEETPELLVSATGETPTQVKSTQTIKNEESKVKDIINQVEMLVETKESEVDNKKKKEIKKSNKELTVFRLFARCLVKIYNRYIQEMFKK